MVKSKFFKKRLYEKAAYKEFHSITMSFFTFCIHSHFLSIPDKYILLFLYIFFMLSFKIITLLDKKTINFTFFFYTYEDNGLIKLIDGLTLIDDSTKFRSFIIHLFLKFDHLVLFISYTNIYCNNYRPFFNTTNKYIHINLLGHRFVPVLCFIYI